MSAASSRSRRLTAIVAACAVALLGVLPAAHVHHAETPGSVEAVIHRHVVEHGHSSPADSALEHDDHAGVRVLSSAVATNTKLAPQQPIVATVVTVLAPDIKGRPPSMRSGLLPVHGPPPLRLPARAPPAHA